MMKQTATAVLDAFRPGPAAGPVNPQGAPATPTPTHHDELHSTALIKLCQGNCVLQHQALNFVSALFLAEPAALEHLKAEGLWELAYGDAFFFWSAKPGASHAASGELITEPKTYNPRHLYTKLPCLQWGCVVSVGHSCMWLMLHISTGGGWHQHGVYSMHSKLRSATAPHCEANGTMPHAAFCH